MRFVAFTFAYLVFFLNFSAYSTVRSERHLKQKSCYQYKSSFEEYDEVYECDCVRRNSGPRTLWGYLHIGSRGPRYLQLYKNDEETVRAFDQELYQNMLPLFQANSNEWEKLQVRTLDYSSFLIKEVYARKHTDLLLQAALIDLDLQERYWPEYVFEESRKKPYRAYRESLDNISGTMRAARYILRIVYKKCRRTHDCLRTTYEYGLLCLHDGDCLKSIELMQKYAQRLRDKGRELSVDGYRLLNEGYQSTMQYEKAVQLLTEAIQKHPELKDLYIQRIAANFELGRYNDVVADFAKQDFGKELEADPTKASLAFAFAVGASKGVIEGIKEYPFTLLSSLRGAGELLWTTTTNPIAVPAALLHDIENVMTLLRSGETHELLEAVAPGLGNLVKNWDSMDQNLKWEKVGYLLGKYGFDCLAFVGQRKVVEACLRLRSTNVLCNVKTSLHSSEGKAKIRLTAEELAKKREEFFATPKKIHADKQGKHIEGHNSRNTLTDEAKRSYSILTHKDPEKLLRENCGKGSPFKGAGDPNISGFRENVDFKEIIGIWKSEDGTIQKPTTWGRIHYDTKGTAHIVPIEPVE